MHPPRCPYRGNASALRASRGVHNKLSNPLYWHVPKIFVICFKIVSNKVLCFALKRKLSITVMVPDIFQLEYECCPHILSLIRLGKNMIKLLKIKHMKLI